MLKNKCLAAHNWSLYPAKKDVVMSCHNITEIGSLSFCDGTVMGPVGSTFDISSSERIIRYITPIRFGNSVDATTVAFNSGCAIAYNVGSVFTTNATTNQFNTTTVFGNGTSAMTVTCASGCTMNYNADSALTFNSGSSATFNSGSTFVSNTTSTFNAAIQFTTPTAATISAGIISYNCTSSSVLTRTLDLNPNPAIDISGISITNAREGGQYVLVITNSSTTPGNNVILRFALGSGTSPRTNVTNYNSNITIPPITAGVTSRVVLSFVCVPPTLNLISASLYD